VKKPFVNAWQRWCAVALFAAAMAWMESATVFYLRSLVGRINPYQNQPLPPNAALGSTELIREAATLVMLATVGWLAGRTWRSRLGYGCMAFGLWDILYYVFLIPICGWPKTLWDWDVLFLIPLPWWGPVLSPVLIAILLIAGGTLIGQCDTPDQPLWPNRWTIPPCLAGAGLALYVFMADAIRVLPQGESAIRQVLPVHFNWPLFIIAWLLMAAPIVDLSRQVWGKMRVEV
jgi:hypothetical protein